MELHSLLVPVSEDVECERAMDVACRLAGRRGTTITLVHVIEIPPALPISAHVKAEEQRGHALLERVAAIADTYGVGVVQQSIHARDAGAAIVACAARRNVELIVIGAPRKRRKPFGSTVEYVLRKADCRVLMIGASPERAAA
jgi:nucleotide-binding universal stress UspA family protein